MIPVKVASRKNPQTQAVKYYMQIGTVRPLTLERIVRNISNRCTVTEPDVLAVLNALQTEIITAMQDGMSVRLEQLGSFRPTVSSFGTESAEKADTSLIKSVRCRFTPGSRLRSALRLTNSEVKFYSPSAPADDETVTD